MYNNVSIPRNTLEKTIDLLESLDTSQLSNFYDYLGILRVLTEKKQKLEIRERYNEIIESGGPDPRQDPRIEHLWQMGQLDDDDGGIVF